MGKGLNRQYKYRLGITMEKGDIIRWEYDAWVVEEGKEDLFDTTNEELAKENGIHDPTIKYGAMYSIVGAERLIKGMDEELLQAEVGKEYIVTIPPENAYGERDAKLVKIHSYREIARKVAERDKNAVPRVGMEVIIDNKRGRIVTVTPGRVVIDFNHPLAGKTLKYRFKILEKIEGEVEKVKAILEMDYGKDVENFKIEVRGEDILIELADSCKYDSSWSIAKYMIVSDIRDFVANKNVKFFEVYPKKEEKKEEKNEPEPAKEEDAKEPESKDKEEKQEEEKKPAKKKTTRKKSSKKESEKKEDTEDKSESKPKKTAKKTTKKSTKKSTSKKSASSKKTEEKKD